MAFLSVQARNEVQSRIENSADERSNTANCLAQGDLLAANSSERVERRKVRILSDGGLTDILDDQTRAALASGPVKDAAPAVQKAFEAHINGNDVQPCWFLSRGAEIRRTVGRIHIWDSFRRIGWGTGFLVAPGLLLTNQHVLNSLETAQRSRVEFDFEDNFDGTVSASSIFDLRPDLFFVSSPAEHGLDYALVAVENKPRPESDRNNVTISDFGSNQLVKDEGKLVKGEAIYCIHHPEGQGKQVNLRENRLMAIDDPSLDGTWLHYETDTATGSSGAPLFNFEWLVVGVHHMAVEKKNAAGQILAKGGDIWTPDMPERLKWWDVNEGLRISRFVKNITEKVESIRKSDEWSNSDHTITEAGLSLFSQMLRPTSTQPLTPPVPVPPKPAVAEAVFRPE